MTSDEAQKRIFQNFLQKCDICHSFSSPIQFNIQWTLADSTVWKNLCY